MADIFSKKKRSELMSRIRSRNNKGTELILASLLRKHRRTGWRRHYRLPGTPDFAFPARKVAIFIDGCFWHGCTRCTRNITPSTNRKFWSEKIVANRKRDRRADRNLRGIGWHVLRIWEHDLKKRPDVCVARIKRTWQANTNGR